MIILRITLDKICEDCIIEFRKHEGVSMEIDDVIQEHRYGDQYVYLKCLH